MDVMEALRWMRWELELYAAYGDFVALPFFVMLFLDRFLLEVCDSEHLKSFLFNFPALCFLLLIPSHWLCSLYLEQVFIFFQESLCSCLLHRVNHGLQSTRYLWIGPGDQVWPDQKINLHVCCCILRILHICTMFWETRQSDFDVSMPNHLATLVLIQLSYIFSFAHVGSVVFAIHDASDVFLEVGKMAKYNVSEWLANTSFLLFVASWILPWLAYYPFWILRSTSYEAILTQDNEKHKFEGQHSSILATCSVGDDIRSDSESEEEHED
ncbi:unnamed protein product [Musa acuminata subsp. malaccensis]|uniref:(wild Malaysian banana) hypothetical protein n=1 Tax=Musa acuminata subsp. malaccensis TaxID=214687 RepID=A0A804KKT9_MUSAM|nr:unnamed protein product [Musa acuminata subsp. malaccensis]